MTLTLEEPLSLKKKGVITIHYTVKEVSLFSNVTVKTLHHYHKIGLLVPCEISEAGYRLYGTTELERLQQILLYRELDFTLDQIKQLLEEEPDRAAILTRQEKQLCLRKQRLDTIINTLRTSITSLEKGEQMTDKDLFKGFESEDSWKEAMTEQHNYLKETYDYELLDSVQIDTQQMNDIAAEATAFMSSLAGALRAGKKHNDLEISRLLHKHLEFLNTHVHPVSAAEFVVQTRYFLSDDFHLHMLEDQQIGLAYYLAAAAESFAIHAS